MFENDCINGKGIFHDINGNIHEGIWEDNVLVKYL
jgi:hypothetical protein